MIRTRDVIEESTQSVTVGEDYDELGLVLIEVEEECEQVASFTVSPAMAIALAELLEKRGNDLISRYSRDAEVPENS